MVKIDQVWDWWTLAAKVAIMTEFQNFVVKGVMVKILWTKVLPS